MKPVFSITKLALLGFTTLIIVAACSSFQMDSPNKLLVDAELQEYAQQCDTAIGKTVMSFNCSDGTELPITGLDSGNCDKPPYLPGTGCFKYNRIGQQDTGDANVGIVFFCRHKKNATSDSRLYSDIAVIQTNYTNGATCFYQQIADDETLNGHEVPAPTTGQFWMSLDKVKDLDNACVQCHDSGPFIRTPYVMQASAHIDAFAAAHRNKTDYWFPGEALKDWNGKVYKAKLANNKRCSGACHLMGANSLDPKFGTSSWLGLEATGATVTEHAIEERAFWMKPRLTEPNADSQVNSQSLAACANGTDRSDNCTLELWGGQQEAIDAYLKAHPTVWRKREAIQ